MKNSVSTLKRVAQFTLLAFCFGVISQAALAQSTTSAMRVVVVDESGSAVDGVDISITHLPTSRTTIQTTKSGGVAQASGLKVGGPYQIRAAEGGSFSSESVNNVFLQLDKTEVVQLTVKAVSTGALEEVVVVSQQVSQELRYGSGADFQQETIESIPSISRDFVSTLATDPKILVDNSVARGPAVSIAGGNYRFNSVTVDGVPQNDNFGLSKNASATQRSPISIDAIEALNVNISPYDVIYGNFIGGNINIVTKSGTNEFHGSVYRLHQRRCMDRQYLRGAEPRH